MRRTLTSATLTLALALPLAACGDDPTPAPRPSASTTPATASPSPTGPVAPELPAAAKVNTAAGAEAFVWFYFEALTYAMQTGETDLAVDHASIKCETCSGIIAKVEDIYGPGGRNEGGGWFLKELVPSPESTAERTIYLAVVEQPRQSLVGPDGKTINVEPKQRFAFRIWVIRESSAWQLREIAKVQGA